MFKNVMLALDLNELASQEKALMVAKEYAEQGANLYVVSVIPPLESGGFWQSYLPANYDKEVLKKAQSCLNEVTQQYLPEIENIKHLAAHGKIYEKICDIAEQLEIDLIITMATRKKKHQHHSGFGPNVARIVRNADCTVLVLR